MSALPGAAHGMMRPARQLLLDKRFQRGEPAHGQCDHVAAKVTGTILPEKQVRRGPKLGPPERLETGETIETYHGTILFR